MNASGCWRPGTGTFYGQKMLAGHVYTVAGDGGYGGGGDGGPATAANMDKPTAVAVDGAGDLVIADSRDWRIRVVAGRTGAFYGKAMTSRRHLYGGRRWRVTPRAASGHERPAPYRWTGRRWSRPAIW